MLKVEICDLSEEKKTNSTSRNKKISEKEFLEVYENSTSPQEAAEKLGMNLGSLNVRASLLRKKGLLTKIFKRGRKAKNN